MSVKLQILLSYSEIKKYPERRQTGKNWDSKHC